MPHRIGLKRKILVVGTFILLMASLFWGLDTTAQKKVFPVVIRMLDGQIGNYTHLVMALSIVVFISVWGLVRMISIRWVPGTISMILGAFINCSRAIGILITEEPSLNIAFTISSIYNILCVIIIVKSGLMLYTVHTKHHDVPKNNWLFWWW
jgi:preprotein translocase subunit SecE